jgi:hypothetical protein
VVVSNVAYSTLAGVWYKVGVGVDGIVRTIDVAVSGDVYVGGEFTGKIARSVADGNFSTLSTGADGTVWALQALCSPGYSGADCTTSAARGNHVGGIVWTAAIAVVIALVASQMLLLVV